MMLRKTCEVKCMSWEPDTIISAGLLKALFPDMKIKFIKDDYSDFINVWKLGKDFFQTIIYNYGLHKLNEPEFMQYIRDLEGIICTMDPHTAQLSKWKKHFLNAVDFSRVYFNSALYKLSDLTELESQIMKSSKSSYVIINDNYLPWYKYVRNYPEIKFIIMDRTKFYVNEDKDVPLFNPVYGPCETKCYYSVLAIPDGTGDNRIPIYQCVKGGGMYVDNSINTFDKFLPFLPKRKDEIWKKVDECYLPSLDVSIRLVEDLVNKYDMYKRGVI